MSIKRISKKAALTALMPRNEAQVSSLILDTITAQTRKEEAIARRDRALAAAAEQIEAEHGYDRQISADDLIIGRNVELLEMWADQHPEVFGKLKSIKRNGAAFGWRAGKWKTELKRGVKWDLVVEELEGMVERANIERGSTAEVDAGIVELGDLAATFLRTKVEPNKEAMIEARDQDEAIALLEHAGVLITQDETFFFEPDRAGQDGPSVIVSA